MLDRFLPKNRVARSAIVWVASAAAVLAVTQLVLPGRGEGGGTPAAILFAGLVRGLVVSLFATGVVLIYRTMRFINFLQGALGSVAALIVGHFLVLTPVPFPIALVLGLALAALVGTLAGIFTLRFLNASRLFLTVFTIVASQVIPPLSSGLQRLPFWPPPADRSSAQVADLAQFSDNLPFAGLKFSVGSFPEQFGFPQLFAIELSVLALLGVAVFLRFTRSGTAVRAMAENPERASLLGIGVGSLSIMVWTIAGLLDGVASVAGQAADVQAVGFAALIPPFTAAVLARFRNIPTAVFAAILIGVAQEAWNWSYRGEDSRFVAMIFVVLCAGLLLQRKNMGRSEAGAGVSWAATDEPRGTPKELQGIGSIRAARVVLIALAILTVAILPLVLPTNGLVTIGQLIITTIAVLSLVVLTGWAGQVSLGQFALVAVGAAVGGSLTATVGIPFWFAVPMAAAVTAVVGVLVGLPALRIKGLFLMVSTFAFAVAIQGVLFDDDLFGWLIPDAVERPKLFVIDFESEKAMYYLLVASLILAVVIVGNLRRSRVGRMLIALRENEANVQSFGVSAVRLKLLAMAIAGALAGFAGALFAHQARAVTEATFPADQNIEVFVAAVIGGVSSPAGALLGSAYTVLAQRYAQSNLILQSLLQGPIPLLVLFVAPGGFISLLNAARDSVYRIVAQRRQIVVPSLFADYDAEALQNRLIPLSEPDGSSGLAAIPGDRRFVLRSELYRGIGERVIDKLGPRKVATETATLGAAARRIEDVEQEERAAPVLEGTR